MTHALKAGADRIQTIKAFLVKRNTALFNMQEIQILMVSTFQNVRTDFESTSCDQHARLASVCVTFLVALLLIIWKRAGKKTFWCRSIKHYIFKRARFSFKCLNMVIVLHIYMWICARMSLCVEKWWGCTVRARIKMSSVFVISSIMRSEQTIEAKIGKKRNLISIVGSHFLVHILLFKIGYLKEWRERVCTASPV